MEPILTLEDFQVRFETRSRLQALVNPNRPRYTGVVMGVSLSIRPGEIFGLVGESGSGKTTVARGVMGLTPPAAGTIRFDGTVLPDFSRPAFRPVRQKTALMFQDPVGSLSPRLTVGAIITEPFRIQNRTGFDLKAEARRLLDMVNLPASTADLHPHQLSGGQARRVGIARALALSPRLIIADEPTAGLDVSVQGEILNLMAGLADDQGVGFLVITHNLPVIRHISDRMAIMYLGRFLEQGRTDDIFSAMKHPYTHALLSASLNPAKGEENRIRLIGEAPSLLQRPSGCEFHTRCPFAKKICRTTFPQASKPGRDHVYFCHYPLN